jgi:hypothetical protein
MKALKTYFQRRLRVKSLILATKFHCDSYSAIATAHEIEKYLINGELPKQSSTTQNLQQHE